MRNIITFIFLFLILFSTNAQSQLQFDYKTKFPNGIDSHANLTTTAMENISKGLIVTINANGVEGQGIKVSENKIITAYDLVAGQKNVSFIDHKTNTTFPIAEYVAADRQRGLILLKTNSRFESFYTFDKPTSKYDSEMFFAKKTGDVLQLDRVENLDTSLYDSRTNITNAESETNYIKVNYKGTEKLQGYLATGAMFEKGMLMYRNGSHYFVDDTSLKKILLQQNLNSFPLENLNAKEVKKNITLKNGIYDIGLKSDILHKKTLEERVTLDYIEKIKNTQTYYFSYETLDSRKRGFNENLHLINLETSEIFHPTPDSDFISTVYKGTKLRRTYKFENLPNDMNRVKIYNVTFEKVNEPVNSKTVNEFDYYLKFFDDIIISNFPQTRKTNYKLENNKEEGTVVFYLQKKSNFRGDVVVYLEGDEIGILNSYYPDSRSDDFCGLEATLNVRLKYGTYKYIAVQKGQKTKGQFTINNKKCLNQRIQF